VNTFPTTGGSGASGAVRKGDLWYVNVAGTLGGKSVKPGASFRALVDDAAQVAANWSILDGNLGYVPENADNKSGDIAAAPTSVDKFPTNKAVVDYVAANAGAIKPFVNQAYPTANAQVSSLGKIWSNNAATAIGEIPGTSSKWVNLLSGMEGGLVALNDTKNVSGGKVFDALVPIKDGYDLSQHTIQNISVVTNTAVNQSNGFIAIDLKSGKTAQFRFNDPNNLIGSGTHFLYIRRTSNNTWSAPAVISENTNLLFTATFDINGFYVGISGASVLGSGTIELKYDYDEIIDSLIKQQAKSVTESYPVVADGSALVSFNNKFGFNDAKRVFNNVPSIVVGGNNTKARYVRNISNDISELPVISTINDSFLSANGFENIDNDNISTTSGSVITYNRFLYSTDGDIFSKLIAGNGKRFRMEVYVYSKYEDFPLVSANNTKVYSNGLSINALLTAVESTTSPKVKKLVFSGVNNFNGSGTFLLTEIRAVATSNYVIGDFGIVGLKIGLYNNATDETTKELIGDWELEKMANPFTDLKANSAEYANYLDLVRNSGVGGYAFNRAEETKRKIALYTNRYTNKYVDSFNRLLVSFNGDSILGSQLDDVTKSAEYLTGAFPPNMSKMIMPRQFFDRYKFAGEDTKFRNLIHSDWTKTGFNISNGKDDKNQTFNQIEVYGGTSGDSAQITVTGHKYLKIVWSEYKGLSYSFDIMRSTNGGTTFAPVETINVTSARGLMVAYKIYELTPATNYIYKIVPTSGFANVCFWGVEMWNNPRLDVVVQSFSGTTAAATIANKLDGFYSEFHKPALIIMDILAINDFSVSTNLNNWIASITELHTFIKNKSIPVVAFGTHFSNTFVKVGCDLTTLQGIPVINIRDKMANPTTNNVIPILNQVDGLHLSNYGNTYYFDEIKKIFG
jgi:hypothetical protein